jgi:hypothetical protein
VNFHGKLITKEELMKKSIALLAICMAAQAAFADVVSLAPGQQIVVPASQPGSVPVVIEAGLLKQTSQLSFLSAYECQNATQAQLKDPNSLTGDSNLCSLDGFIALLNYIGQYKAAITANKPTISKNTYAQAPAPDSPYLFRIDVNGTWSSIKIDLNTGSPTEVTASIDYNIKNSPTPNLSTGGAYRERNMRLAAADKKIYSDVEGVNTATKARPSVTYKQVSLSTWTFDSWVGPALPINRLAYASSEVERSRILIEAGFKVTPLGDGTLYAVGSYKTLNMRMTTEGQGLFVNSLGLSKNSRMAVEGINNGNVDSYNPLSLTANIGYFIN